MSSVDLEKFNEMPFARHIGFEFVFARDGDSAVRLTVGADHANAQGIGHGGVVPVLSDAAGTLAVLSTFEHPEEMRVLTADLRVNLVSAARLGAVLTARGESVYVGKSTAFSRVEIRDDADEVIGLAQLTCVARPAAGRTPA